MLNIPVCMLMLSQKTFWVNIMFVLELKWIVCPLTFFSKYEYQNCLDVFILLVSWSTFFWI